MPRLPILFWACADDVDGTQRLPCCRTVNNIGDVLLMSEWDSKYFKRSEFACKCGCGFDTVDYELVKVLEYIREHFDRPLQINSGCRCATHNRTLGSGASICVGALVTWLLLELAPI